MPAVKFSPLVAALAPSATLAAAAKARELKAKGIKVLDFTLGEPDFNTPAAIQEAAIEAMRAGHTHYTPSGGIPELKKAVCQAYERDYGLKYEPSQVLISNGAKHSLHNVITTLCGPGDEVIIPTPYWVSYSALVELAGAKAVLVPTTEESGFTMSPEQFEQAITPNTRMLLLNNPSNPTGAAYKPAQLEALAKVAVKRQIFVLSDEIYEKLMYPGSEFRSFASFGPEVKDLTIIVSGVSKAYAMTGWRIGWTIASAEIIKGMDNLQSQETSNPCSVSQYAALAAVSGDQTCVEEMRQQFEKRRTYVLERMAPWREKYGITYAEPGGAFYAFFNVAALFGKTLPGGKTVNNASEFCTALLEQAHVALVTGDAFGAPGYVRLSFATSIDTLKAGFDKLDEFFAAAK